MNLPETSERTSATGCIRDLCRYIERHADEPLTLERLARQAGLSPSHLQRRFKAEIGLSPRQYHEACRLRLLRGGLRAGRSVTRAIQDAGFGSTSRVYEKVGSRLGMTPSQYRSGASGMSIGYACGDSALGLLMLGATDRGLCFVQFGDDEPALLAALRREFPEAELQPMPAAREDDFAGWMQVLDACLRGRPADDLPLDLRGTAFQMRVWRALQDIPSGELRSYSELAAAIGAPRAVRAVASACARNRVAVLVPCHRVIRGDGGLGGYKWGLARKRALIGAERDGVGGSRGARL